MEILVIWQIDITARNATWRTWEAEILDDICVRIIFVKKHKKYIKHPSLPLLTRDNHGNRTVFRLSDILFLSDVNV